FGRMARRLQRLQPYASEPDAVAVAERRERILRARRGAEVDRRAEPVAQFEMPGDEGGVKMRQEDGRDAETGFVGEGQVLIDVALRIDDRGIVRLLVTHDVRRVGEAVQVELLQDHDGIIMRGTRSGGAEMAKYTRGEFLGFGAALAGAYGLGRLPGAAVEAAPIDGGTDPDQIVVNAGVYTSDAAQPRAEAFAVKTGRFVAVGSTSDIRNLASARTDIVDAQRMTVTPGFIDAHCHPSGIEELYGVNCNVRTVAQLLDAVH